GAGERGAADGRPVDPGASHGARSAGRRPRAVARRDVDAVDRGGDDRPGPGGGLAAACDRDSAFGNGDHLPHWPGISWKELVPMTVVGNKPHPIFLAGRWGASPDVLEGATPAKPDEPAGATYQATEAQYEEAVEAAVAAFETTRTLPAYERGRILREISAGIKGRREELGRLIALEAGKPIRDALIEVDRAALTFRLGAEEAERMTGELIPLDLMPNSKDRVGITPRFPIGPNAAP